MDYDLGYIDLEDKTLQPLDNPFGPTVSPMYPVHSVSYVSGPDIYRIVAETGDCLSAVRTTPFGFCHFVQNTCIFCRLRPSLSSPIRLRNSAQRLL